MAIRGQTMAKFSPSCRCGGVSMNNVFAAVQPTAQEVKASHLHHRSCCAFYQAHPRRSFPATRTSPSPMFAPLHPTTPAIRS